MKRLVGILLAGVCAALAPAAGAQSGEEVVKSKCFVCHAVDQKKVATSFKDISAKYKGNKGAEARLLGMLREGKAHPKMVDATDAQLTAAVQYVLKQ